MAGHIASWIATFFAILLLFSVCVASFPTHYPDYRCATNAPEQQVLSLNSTSIRVGNRPWGLVYLNESIAFAAVNFSIVVLDTSAFAPKLKAIIPFPLGLQMGNVDIMEDGYGYRELAISNDKKNLYVATGYGAVIFDVEKAVEGKIGSFAGVLSSDGYVGRSAVEMSITPDDKYVFISQEFGSNASYNRGAVEVFNVTRLDNGTVLSSWRGFIALGYAVVGQQFSKDYTKLFVTSEMNSTTASPNNTAGVISVLDVQKLKHTPGKSLITKFTGGCRPVRCHLSLDGNELWVTERDVNHASVYDAEKLANNQTTPDVLLAIVNTGTSPIGVAVVGNHILTADSNRFDYSNATTGITVINTAGALTRGRVDFPQIPTGDFPRSLAMSPSGDRLLVSEFGEGTVRVIDVSSLNNY